MPVDPSPAQQYEPLDPGGESGEIKGAGAVLRGFVWVTFAGVLLRFIVLWADAAGASLPRLGSVGFTLVFGAFSLAHAASVFGWRRAVSFLLICAVVTWSFEEVGVATGLIYGHYHCGVRLGAKLGAVPFIIPLAWFMMIYASWVVAHVLLQGAGDPVALPGSLARSLVAAAVMTSWDVVMDPGNALEGVWTWENGGAYFGVPLQNFAGWMVTTFVVYRLQWRCGIFGPCRWVERRSGAAISVCLFSRMRSWLSTGC